LTSIKQAFGHRASNVIAPDLSGACEIQDFHPRHSAVSLYKFLEQVVSDYMTRDVATVTPTMAIRELGQRFKETDFNSFPVVDNGQVVGVVSKFDYLACFEFTPARMVPRYDDLMRRTVAGVMTREFIYVGCDTRLTRVLQLMIEHRLRSLPILDAGARLEGIIAREDVIRALEYCAQCEAEGA
jgi:CBS domain-containing protein